MKRKPPDGAGRYLRAALGTVMVLSSIIVFYLGREQHHGWEDAALHIAVLVAGLFMIDHRIGGEITRAIKAWKSGVTASRDRSEEESDGDR